MVSGLLCFRLPQSFLLSMNSFHLVPLWHLKATGSNYLSSSLCAQVLGDPPKPPAVQLINSAPRGTCGGSGCLSRMAWQEPGGFTTRRGGRKRGWRRPDSAVTRTPVRSSPGKPLCASAQPERRSLQTRVVINVTTSPGGSGKRGRKNLVSSCQAPRGPY